MFAKILELTELEIPTGITTDEAHSEIQTQPVTAKAKISKCTTLFKYLHIFLYFLIIKSLFFISCER